MTVGRKAEVLAQMLLAAQGDAAVSPAGHRAGR